MTESSHSQTLRNLSNDYYRNHISFEEYRIQRKLILDTIDREMNGKTVSDQAQAEPEKDSTFMQTISFMKNADIDK